LLNAAWLCSVCLTAFRSEDGMLQRRFKEGALARKL
jgi:hypothetical protein